MHIELGYAFVPNGNTETAMPATQTSIESLPAFRDRVDRFFLLLNQREIAIVAAVMHRAQSRPLSLIAHITNTLCDGWIYGLLLLFLASLREWRLTMVAAIGVVISFSFYFATKPQFARIRPCNFDLSLQTKARCLDRYSFPSGHCMTFTAVAAVLCWQHHAIILPIACGLLLLSWARLAAAHHYPTDLIAGIGVGLSVGIPMAACLL